MNKILQGNCLDVLKTLDDNSVDSIVTDPPYGLVSIVKRFGKVNSAPAKFGTDGAFSRASKGFMGKEWDGSGIEYNVDMWSECLRVLKPGGHLLAFSGTRTYHRMAVAIEDAGFEVRDQIAWCYGQGFPKSLNISLQIKKKYNIGLCTCNVFEPMIKLECNNLEHSYENSNNKRDNVPNGDNDGLGFGEQIQSEGTNDNEVEEQAKNTNLSTDGIIRKESEVCELSENNNQKKQGHKEVSKSVLQSGMCESISENEGFGNITIRSGLEENQTTSEGEGQGLSDMQNKTKDRVAGSSLDTVQNGGKEHNGEPCESLSQLPQQDRKNNRKRVEEIKNDCNTEEWSNLSRFICSKCYCLKKDIGGTALKPSIEPICMARKPLAEKTVAENVLKYGTGGINIDESRVGTEVINIHNAPKGTFAGGEPNRGSDTESYRDSIGRFPANLIHDNSEEVRECFPETKNGGQNKTSKRETWLRQETKPTEYSGDSGNASRFFYKVDWSDEEYENLVANTSKEIQDKWKEVVRLYDDDMDWTPIEAFVGSLLVQDKLTKKGKSIIYTPKASKSERNKGCEELADINVKSWHFKCKKCGKTYSEQSYKSGCHCENPDIEEWTGTSKNNHPTVKPIALMEYLIKMVTPKGGIVLDPFAGSGSTLIAAKKNNFKYIGIELDPEYIKIAEARLNSVRETLL